MGRRREVAPQFYTHLGLYKAEASTGLPCRLAFSGLWGQCDREGRFEWKPEVLKLAILPWDQIDFEQVLMALTSAGFVRRYVVDGKEYGDIPSFLKWQHPHPREAPSKIPPCPRSDPGNTLSMPSPSDSQAFQASQASQDLSGPAGGTAHTARPGQDQGLPLPEAGDEPVVREEWLPLVRRFPRSGDRWAVVEFLETAPQQRGWVALLGACLDGMTDRPISPEALAETCRDFGTKPKSEWNAKYFRICAKDHATRLLAGLSAVGSQSNGGAPSWTEIAEQRRRDREGAA